MEKSCLIWTAILFPSNFCYVIEDNFFTFITWQELSITTFNKIFPSVVKKLLCFYLDKILLDNCDTVSMIIEQNHKSYKLDPW